MVPLDLTSEPTPEPTPPDKPSAPLCIPALSSSAGLGHLLLSSTHQPVFYDFGWRRHNQHHNIRTCQSSLSTWQPSLLAIHLSNTRASLFIPSPSRLPRPKPPVSLGSDIPSLFDYLYLLACSTPLHCVASATKVTVTSNVHDVDCSTPTRHCPPRSIAEPSTCHHNPQLVCLPLGLFPPGCCHHGQHSSQRVARR